MKVTEVVHHLEGISEVTFPATQCQAHSVSHSVPGLILALQSYLQLLQWQEGWHGIEINKEKLNFLSSLSVAVITPVKKHPHAICWRMVIRGK